jgi:hypothetical protein
MTTAVEWFIINLIQVCGAPPEGTWKEVENLLQQAKQMEKEQINNAHYEGSENYRRKYYNETFKSE